MLYVERWLPTHITQTRRNIQLLTNTDNMISHALTHVSYPIILSLSTAASVTTEMYLSWRKTWGQSTAPQYHSGDTYFTQTVNLCPIYSLQCEISEFKYNWGVSLIYMQQWLMPYEIILICYSLFPEKSPFAILENKLLAYQKLLDCFYYIIQEQLKVKFLMHTEI